jgi:uncharacterized RDD family membrane protein YckC
MMSEPLAVDLPVLPPVAYGTLQSRFRALVIDSVLVLLVFIVVLVLLETTRALPHASQVIFGGFVLFLFLYEPILVSTGGGTIGHRLMNLRVVADSTGANPSFWRAVERMLIKGFLGIVSFAGMAFTARYQAIHDSVTHTTVQVRDPAKASPGDILRERSLEEGLGLPSTGRRLGVIVLYGLLLTVLVSFGSVPLISESCTSGDFCTPQDTSAADAAGLVWVVLLVAIVILGWKGRLLGARRSRAVPARAAQ